MLKQVLRRLTRVGDRVRYPFRRAAGRRRLRKRLDSRDSAAPLKIVIGAHNVFEPGWIPTDREYLDLLRPAEWPEFFAPGTIDRIAAEHVWEHLTPGDASIAARTCYDFLKPGGVLRIAVPDGLNPDASYLEMVKPGGSGRAAHDHKVLYTHASLSAVFTAAGFYVDLLEGFDESGAFHMRNWDPADGKIWRSARFDPRNQDGTIRYTSIIIDARKPAG